MNDATRATVCMLDGQMVLDDPIALNVIKAVEKHNCKNTFYANLSSIVRFKQRLATLNKTADEMVIVVINVDDVHGGPLADALMPGCNWQEIRNRGEIPFARGFAGRDFIQKCLELFDREAANKLKEKKGVAVVVVDRGVSEIFSAGMLLPK